MRPKRVATLTRGFLGGVLRRPRETLLTLLAPGLLAAASALLWAGELWRGRWLAMERFYPVVIGTVGFLLPAWLALRMVARDRENGTLEKLLSTPLGPLELTAGYGLLHLALSGVVALLMLVPLVVAFPDAHAAGHSVVWALLTVVAASGAGVGVAAALVSRRPGEPARWLPVLLTGAILGSGSAWPMGALPLPLRALAQALPAPHVSSLSALVVSGGGGLRGAVWLHVLVPAAWLVLSWSAVWAALRGSRP